MTLLSFRELQTQLKPQWGRSTAVQGPDVDVLMVPSLSMDQNQIDLVTGAHHYEERQLFSLIRLRDPGVRMVFQCQRHGSLFGLSTAWVAPCCIF